MSGLSRSLLLSNTPDDTGKCVLYIMSRDQRVRDNHALLAAQAEALEHKLPLVVMFNVLPSTGFRRREHYQFMIEGLQEVSDSLDNMNIPFITTIGDMHENATKIMNYIRPRSLYFDFSPLRGPRAAQKKIAAAANCRVIVVDTHNVIPVWVTSGKEEFAAHTIRRKIHKLIEEWAVEHGALKKHPYTLSEIPKGATKDDTDTLLANIPACGIEHGFKSGEKAAELRLSQFIETGLTKYANDRNDALAEAQSDLSPYLHYGQISSLRILLDIMQSKSHPPQIFTSFKIPAHGDTVSEKDGIDSFIEELIVRKELADNFCFYNPNYDNLDGAKDWAKKTLADHADDPREFVYTKQQLEDALTHDELWNAAQIQLRKSGKIHGYLRMYWAKKILEWTNSPKTAIAWTIELNDTYHLDGGDPNGYVGILWSIAGLHDRPWFNRDVYGTVRYMARSGAEKKFDVTEYINKWTSQNTTPTS